MGPLHAAAFKKLDDIVKLDLLSGEDQLRVIEIWMTYHAKHKSACAGVLTKAELDAITFRATKCPLVLLPVRRDDGYFVLAAQFEAPRFFLTALDDYRRNPETAEAVLGIGVHTELVESKDLALTRGDFYEGGVLSKDAAEKALRDLFHCYWDTAAFKAVQLLNQNPDAFDWDAFAKNLLARE